MAAFVIQIRKLPQKRTVAPRRVFPTSSRSEAISTTASVAARGSFIKTLIARSADVPVLAERIIKFHNFSRIIATLRTRLTRVYARASSPITVAIRFHRLASLMKMLEGRQEQNNTISYEEVVPPVQSDPSLSLFSANNAPRASLMLS